MESIAHGTVHTQAADVERKRRWLAIPNQKLVRMGTMKYGSLSKTNIRCSTRWSTKFPPELFFVMAATRIAGMATAMMAMRIAPIVEMKS